MTRRQDAQVSISRRLRQGVAAGTGLALLAAVPILAFVFLYRGAVIPAGAVEFAPGDDPYTTGLRVTDRKRPLVRRVVGWIPLYEGQDEIGVTLNNWQLADFPNLFSAK